MSLKLNTNSTDITVYDKASLGHATGSKIVPLHMAIRGNLRVQLINMFSAVLKLSDAERNLYYCLIDNMNAEYNVSVNDIRKKYISSYMCSHVTFNRSIHKLHISGVVQYVECNTRIAVTPAYNVNLYDEYAKYVVIEVNRVV